MSWYSLPVELRETIFDLLGDDKSRPYQSPDSRQSERRRKSTRSVQSQYAAVNREWQAYFEAQNFKCLILGHSDVREFGNIVSRYHRAGLVRWIWLRVELPKYGCRKCAKQESLEERTAHEARFTLAIWELLGILSEHNDGHPGITLELSVHSPSDAAHYCKELRNTIDDTAWHASDAAIYPRNDRRHGWRNGRRSPLRPMAYLRVFGNPKGLGINLESVNLPPSEGLPRAKVVRALVIRLQFLRHFSIRRGLDRVIQSLPWLLVFKYECRRGINAGPVTGQVFRQREHQLLFNHVLLYSRNLRILSVYEASNYSYSQVPTPFAPDPESGRALGDNSRLLGELYAAWMVEAADFFHDFWPPADTGLQRREWTNMKYLALTTSLLDTSHCEPLLQAAAAAAEQMPKLQTMELWGRKERERFLYVVEDRRHFVLVPQGMTGTLTSATIRSWERVAAIRGNPGRLTIEDMPQRINGHRTHSRSILSRSASHTTCNQLSMERRRLAGP